MNSSLANTSDVRLKEWDRHSGEKWTYFAEEDKQLISHFLRPRVSGKRNLELGGGWYLTVPGASVVDLSPVALSHNPNEEKLVFDIDTFSESNTLPYAANSFDNIVIVSVWQYIQNSQALLNEIKRLLIPGGKLYIINLRNAGIQELKKGPSSCGGIIGLMMDNRLDCHIDEIPGIGGFQSHIECLTVAMPQTDIFGDIVSTIKNKAEKIIENDTRHKDPREFYESFFSSELTEYHYRLVQLEKMDCSADISHLLKVGDDFSDVFLEQTGILPIITADTFISEKVYLLQDIPVRILLGSLSECTHKASDYFKRPVFSRAHTTVSSEFNKITGEIPESISGLVAGEHFSSKWHIVFSPRSGIKITDAYGYEVHGEVANKYQSVLSTIFGFVRQVPLSSYTRELNEKWNAFLRQHIPEADDIIFGLDTTSYYYSFFQRKQKRTIDTLLKKARERGLMLLNSQRKMNIFKRLQQLEKCLQSEFDFANLSIREGLHESEITFFDD